jgi:hypothetical protein
VETAGAIPKASPARREMEIEKRKTRVRGAARRRSVAWGGQEVRPSDRDREITVDLRGVTFEEVLDLLLETHGLFYKVVNSTTVRLVED